MLDVSVVFSCRLKYKGKDMWGTVGVRDEQDDSGGGRGWGLIGGSRNQVIGGTIYAQSDGRSIAFYISEVTILNLDKEGCMASVTPTPRRDVWHL